MSSNDLGHEWERRLDVKMEETDAFLRRTMGQTTDELLSEAEAFAADESNYQADLVRRLCLRFRKHLALGNRYLARMLEIEDIAGTGGDCAKCTVVVDMAKKPR